mmetsp:Transcript_20670/g.50137  ORF Transcript_20670/g.50137 Transcript_20670/m.50137 type:complete len:99 (+) Transcript_20670:189-485(+)
MFALLVQMTMLRMPMMAPHHNDGVVIPQTYEQREHTFAGRFMEGFHHAADAQGFHFLTFQVPKLSHADFQKVPKKPWSVRISDPLGLPDPNHRGNSAS